MAGDLEVDYSEPGGPEQMEVTEAAQTSTEVQAASGHNQTPEGVSIQATNPEAAQASQQVPVKEEPKTETTEGQQEAQESQTPKEEREESQREKTSTEVKRKTLDVEASTRGGTGGSQNPVTPPKAAPSESNPSTYRGYTQAEWDAWYSRGQPSTYRRTQRQQSKTDEELLAQRKRPGKREREAQKRAQSSHGGVRLQEAPQSKVPPPPPPSPRQGKGTEGEEKEKPPSEVWAKKEKEAATTKEEERPGPSKSARTQDAQPSSASYEYTDEEEEEQEVILSGKANSHSKTWIGELPTLLNFEGSTSEHRLTLFKKGSYRAVYTHSRDRTILWKIGQHGDEEKWLRLYGQYTMPKLHRKIPVRVNISHAKNPGPGENLYVLEVERMEPLPHLGPAHFLAMFIILLYMKGQGVVLKDTGTSNWGLRWSLTGLAEMVLLDAGSWKPDVPGPLKSLKEVSGFRDMLNPLPKVRNAIERILREAKPETQVYMAYAVETLLEQGQLGLDLWRSLVRQRVLVCAPTRDHFVMVPVGESALTKPNKWELKLLKEQAKT